MTSREENVLAARDPSVDDENDWQEFSLSDVKVLIPGKSRYANLLTASPDNPVRVTGCLDEVEEDQESLVLDEDYLSKRIVIDNVTHYAYGQHADGEVGIWVAGRAGWFSISPARGYRPMFNEMVEAIDLLYFLADRHTRKRRKRKLWNPSVEYLCDEYVGHTHGICEDGDDSAEVFYKHHSFLLEQMINGKEGVNWTETNIFQHLCEKFPDDYERIKSLREPQQPETNNEVNGEAKEAEAHSSSDPDALAKAQADSIYQVILDLKEAGHLAKRQLNLDLVASTLMSRFEIDTQEYARDLITARAPIIIELMDEAKTPSFDWSRKAIYRELKTVAGQNDAQHVAITPLRPRASNEDESSSDESEENKDEHPRGRRRRVRKSILRPKMSVSAKVAGKRARDAGGGEDVEMSDDSEHGPDNVETPSKVRGHELVRDPLSARAKRRTRSILSDSGSGSVQQQKTPLQETLQTGNISAAAVDADQSTAMDPSTIDPDNDDYPSDTWVCKVQGCGKVIYKASSKRCKELIQDHTLGHAEDTKTKLDLVFAEQRLNVNISVDHLVSKIRDFGAFEAGTMLGDTDGDADAGEEAASKRVKR